MVIWRDIWIYLISCNFYLGHEQKFEKNLSEVFKVDSISILAIRNWYTIIYRLPAIHVRLFGSSKWY